MWVEMNPDYETTSRQFNFQVDLSLHTNAYEPAARMPDITKGSYPSGHLPHERVPQVNCGDRKVGFPRLCDLILLANGSVVVGKSSPQRPGERDMDKILNEKCIRSLTFIAFASIKS